MLSVDMENKENGSLDVKNSVENGRPPDPADWAVTDVVNYFRTAGFEEQASAFQEQRLGYGSREVLTLSAANITSVEAKMMKYQLCWAGHCVQMADIRLLKQVFFSQLSHGKRTCRGQRRRYKNTLKVCLKKGSIDSTNWEELADHKLEWHCIIHQASAHFEENHLSQKAAKWQRRKESVQHPSQKLCSLQGTFFHICGITCRAQVGLLSHLKSHQ
nr:sterile alpha motif domain-containing protein 13 isoform X2 [Chelonoidis abingdonii]XP_032654773.1 sterile alpha motif domain-containing protein 13 isoform X2 [Chelonoidis abingdonii]